MNNDIERKKETPRIIYKGHSSKISLTALKYFGFKDNIVLDNMSTYEIKDMLGNYLCDESKKCNGKFNNMTSSDIQFLSANFINLMVEIDAYFNVYFGRIGKDFDDDAIYIGISLIETLYILNQKMNEYHYGNYTSDENRSLK